MGNKLIKMVSNEEQTYDMLCPFRTHTKAFQTYDENKLPVNNQTAEFMPCEYKRCPFFDKGRCVRADVEIGRRYK